MAEQTQIIRMSCTCGARFKVPASAAGKRARCKTCQEIIRIPQPAPPPPPPPQEEGFGLLEDLAAESTAAEQVASGPRSRACPHCHQAISADAVLCTACGYHLEKGKVMKRPSAASVERKAKVTRAVRGAGSFGKGCALSAAGATVGALVWCGVGMGGVEVGWIAWGIGVLAGIGMVKGASSEGEINGMTASAIAVGGILLGKALIVVCYIYPQFQQARSEIHAFNDIDPRAYTYAFHHAGRKSKLQGISPYSEMDDPYFDAAMNEAAAMTPEELDTEMALIEAWYTEDIFDDPEAAKAELVYLRVQDILDEKFPEPDDPEAEYDMPTNTDWQLAYNRQFSLVRDMDAATRDSELKTLLVRQRREENITAVALLEAERETMRAAAPLDGSAYDRHYEAARAAAEAMAPAALEEAGAVAKAWETDGRWDDPEYLRLELIYTHAEEAMWDEDLDWGSDDYERQYAAAWTGHHATAVETVDRIAPGDYADALRDLERAQREEIAAAISGMRGDALMSEATSVFSLGFSQMFSAFDALWFILAIASAYRIGVGAADDD